MKATTYQMEYSLFGKESRRFRGEKSFQVEPSSTLQMDLEVC